jgi:epoxyqueuosine reductase
MLPEHGASLVGFAATDEVEDLPGWARRFPRAISIGAVLSRAVLDQLEDGPTVLYKHHYRAVNHLLDRIALLTSTWLQKRGFQGLSIPASVVVDWKAQLGHLSHRSVAVAAGLGWMGRSNLLVTPSLGSAVRLVTVLTDAPLAAASTVASGCGSCVACRSICPAGAIGESSRNFKRWDCFDQLKELSRQRNLGVYLCGLCQKVCQPPQQSRSNLQQRTSNTQRPPS